MSGSGSTQQQNQLVSQFRRSMAANLKKLTKMCEADLELQQLLIGAAENYVAEKQRLADSGQSLLEASRAKRRKTSAGAGGEGEAEEEEEEAPIAIPAGVMLRRGLRVFKGWGVKLCQDFFGYIEPTVRKDIKGYGRDELHRLMEYACDIRLCGATLDRIGVDDKADLFAKLRQSYEMLGRRLRQLTYGPVGVDWKTSGHFIVTEPDGRVEVFCRILSQKISLTQDILQGDVGPFAGCVFGNYSRYSATLQTPQNTDSLHSLFPRLCRALLRRPSDALGATGVAVSAAEGRAETALGDDEAPEQEDGPPSPVMGSELRGTT